MAAVWLGEENVTENCSGRQLFTDFIYIYIKSRGQGKVEEGKR